MIPEALANALAPRYQIVRQLGAGGMATVYLAEDTKHRREVAVKVLRPELAATLGPERFLREIETTARALRNAGRPAPVHRSRRPRALPASTWRSSRGRSLSFVPPSRPR